jgi:hypothetical protein
MLIKIPLRLRWRSRLFAGAAAAPRRDVRASVLTGAPRRWSILVAGSPFAARLQQEGLADRLDLPRLGLLASTLLIDALLRGPSERCVLERVIALAAGNPKDTEEAVRALSGEGWVCRWRASASPAMASTVSSTPEARPA